MLQSPLIYTMELDVLAKTNDIEYFYFCCALPTIYGDIKPQVNNDNVVDENQLLFQESIFVFLHFIGIYATTQKTGDSKILFGKGTI